MNFDVLQRLDYPGEGGWSSAPIAASGNGDVLMSFGAAGYMNLPPYYIVPPSGSVINVKPAGVPAGGFTPRWLSNANVILSAEVVGILQPGGAWVELPIPSSPGTKVSSMNSLGQIIGVFQDSRKNNEYVACLANPSGSGPVTYTLVSLAEAFTKAGITGSGGILAINDAGWVLLSGDTSSTIVNISNPNDPAVVHSNIPLFNVSTMSSAGSIAGVQYDDDGSGTLFEFYDPSKPTQGVGGVISVDLSGLWTLSGTYTLTPDDLSITIGKVNSSGQLVGTIGGTLDSGVYQSFGYYWDLENGGQLLTAGGLDEGAVIIAATSISDTGKIVATVLEAPGGNTFGVILDRVMRLGNPPTPKPIGPGPIRKSPF